jgi:hypothetical protein
MVGLVVPRGKPRYVKGMLPTLQPKVLAKCNALLSVMLIGTKKLLSKFTRSPVESEKGLRSPFKLNKVLVSPGRIRRVSSAY